jgi:carbon storage regulator
MLVLSRKVGESIYIGSEVNIKLISISGNKVRLGIEAPEWLKVWRGELDLSLDIPTTDTHLVGEASPTPRKPR